MGCIWSSEDRDRCLYCNRRPVNNLLFIDNVCQICVHQASRVSRPQTSVQNRPRFGEFRCACGRFWTSQLSWAHTYQLCKKCRNHTVNGMSGCTLNKGKIKNGNGYPGVPLTRDLRQSDLLQGKTKEHQKDFCQMCQQLGHYCGNFGKNSRSRTRGKR